MVAEHCSSNLFLHPLFQNTSIKKTSKRDMGDGGGGEWEENNSLI